jgi:hypothetical protein
MSSNLLYSAIATQVTNLGGRTIFPALNASLTEIEGANALALVAFPAFPCLVISGLTGLLGKMHVI